jgi:hypothetical protein
MLIIISYLILFIEGSAFGKEVVQSVTQELK